MWHFLIRFFGGVIITISIVIAGIFTLNLLTADHSTNDCSNIYIWGDSQTFQGIDIDLLQKLTRRKILSSALHGSGVYDFLVFTEKVPDSCFCIVGYSQCCLLRKKELDNNRSGCNWSALKILHDNNYDNDELLTIMRSNNQFMQKHIFHNSCRLYAYNDTLVYSEPLSGFECLYSNEPLYYNDKYRVFVTGLNNLLQKQCSVILVEFPYYSEVANIYFNSPYRKHIDNDIHNVANKYCGEKVDSIYINDKDSLLMHDLSHLNEVGSRRVTQKIVEFINMNKIGLGDAKFIVINGLKCN